MFVVFLWSLVAFVASAIAIWFAVVLGVVAYWDFAESATATAEEPWRSAFLRACHRCAGRHHNSRDCLCETRKMAARERHSDSGAMARDKRYFAIFGSAIAGWLSGSTLQGLAGIFFGPARYDSYQSAPECLAARYCRHRLRISAGFAAKSRDAAQVRTPE